jgi:hypothetical protein
MSSRFFYFSFHFCMKFSLKRLTTEVTERKLFFRKLTEFLLPPLFPQLFILFFPSLLFTTVPCISTLALYSAI